ncbi:DUF4395 domain-containing protein [Bacillus alkalicellulosilyticus]|uniref:DUF4395 domain-containing protein n=1 Tax=Alkalihalobacterium alkalicellulosilyticum TaxID=1912214 RepID=UPI0009973C0D|nr:DUF4395 domain-containing protein [Bacillus alkalicellulosilyticus]
MKEIPIYLVKSNQLMMVTLTVSALLLQSWPIVALTLVLVLISLIFGGKANIAFMIAKKLNKKDRSTEETESVELTRFNQTIAAILLAIGLGILLAGHWSGWILVAMVTVAATIALLGFCVGCFMYFQLKKMRYQLKK